MARRTTESAWPAAAERRDAVGASRARATSATERVSSSTSSRHRSLRPAKLRWSATSALALSSNGSARLVAGFEWRRVRIAAARDGRRSPTRRSSIRLAEWRFKTSCSRSASTDHRQLLLKLPFGLVRDVRPQYVGTCHPMRVRRWPGRHHARHRSTAASAGAKGDSLDPSRTLTPRD
jgi:hypothetical protein